MKIHSKNVYSTWRNIISLQKCADNRKSDKKIRDKERKKNKPNESHRKYCHHTVTRLWQTIQFVYQLSPEQINIWSTLSRCSLKIESLNFIVAQSHRHTHNGKHTNYTQIEIILRRSFMLIDDKAARNEKPQSTKKKRACIRNVMMA